MTGENPPGVVVPFRPRDQVPRMVRSFRSEPAATGYCASAPVRIDGTVIFTDLLRGLRSAGLTLQHDKRTGGFVVMPDPEARP